MEITEEGTKVLNQLSDYFKVYKDDNHYAKHIKSNFGIKEVYVIPGNADMHEEVKSEMGRQAGHLLEDILYEDAIVSVTGGSTMANVSRAMHLLPFNVFLFLHVVVLVKIWCIKQIQLQQVWHNKVVAITPRYMYQIM